MGECQLLELGLLGRCVYRKSWPYLVGGWAGVCDWGEVYLVDECIEQVGHIWWVGK